MKNNSDFDISMENTKQRTKCGAHIIVYSKILKFCCEKSRFFFRDELVLSFGLERMLKKQNKIKTVFATDKNFVCRRSKTI